MSSWDTGPKYNIILMMTMMTCFHWTCWWHHGWLLLDGMLVVMWGVGDCFGWEWNYRALKRRHQGSNIWQFRTVDNPTGKPYRCCTSCILIVIHFWWVHFHIGCTLNAFASRISLLVKSVDPESAAQYLKESFECFRKHACNVIWMQ